MMSPASLQVKMRPSNCAEQPGLLIYPAPHVPMQCGTHLGGAARLGSCWLWRCEQWGKGVRVWGGTWRRWLGQPGLRRVLGCWPGRKVACPCACWRAGVDRWALMGHAVGPVFPRELAKGGLIHEGHGLNKRAELAARARAHSCSCCSCSCTRSTAGVSSSDSSTRERPLVGGNPPPLSPQRRVRTDLSQQARTHSAPSVDQPARYELAHATVEGAWQPPEQDP